MICLFVCLCWGLTSQSTIFQSCRDGATASWVINQYFRGVKCLAQGHNTAAVGFEPPTSRSRVGNMNDQLYSVACWFPCNDHLENSVGSFQTFVISEVLSYTETLWTSKALTSFTNYNCIWKNHLDTGFPQALEKSGEKNPSMEKSWNLKINEKSWKNHGILAWDCFLDVNITQFFPTRFAC